MALTVAKPAPNDYSINTSATHHPPFLWVPDMDTGATTIVNRGSGATATLAMTGMTRHIDGTHGPYWRTNAGSSNALLNQNLGLTTGYTLLAIARVTLGSGGNLTQNVVSLGSNGHADDRWSRIALNGTSGDVSGRPYKQISTVARAGPSADYGADWFMFSSTVNFSAKSFNIKVNDSSQLGSTYTLAATNLGNRITLGVRASNTLAEYTTVDFLAVALWPDSELTNTELNSINSDPWELLGLGAAAGGQRSEFQNLQRGFGPARAAGLEGDLQ